MEVIFDALESFFNFIGIDGVAESYSIITAEPCTVISNDIMFVIEIGDDFFRILQSWEDIKAAFGFPEVESHVQHFLIDYVASFFPDIDCFFNIFIGEG